MIERAIAAAAPFAWVAADSVYGVAGVEGALRRAGKGYVIPTAESLDSTRGIPFGPVL
jgi:SRSO17 transposase